MTYSIVARDPETGELGVAVQTCWFGVGALVPWAEPGVGAVATQSFVEVAHGPNGLAAMREGRSAKDALEEVLTNDPGREKRQLGMVDASGGVAAHTGSACVQPCGSATGDGVSCQANMMERDTVWGVMLEAFQGATGDLADRMVAALRAAEAEGGDARGRLSAGLIVVSGSREDPAWKRRIDLRVEAHEDPVAELARALTLWRAYDHLDRGSTLAEQLDLEGAAREMERAAELAPHDDQLAFWSGLGFMGAGRVDEAKAAVERARAVNPRWAPYLRRIGEAGLIPNDPDLLDALMPLEPPR